MDKKWRSISIDIIEFKEAVNDSKFDAENNMPNITKVTNQKANLKQLVNPEKGLYIWTMVCSLDTELLAKFTVALFTPSVLERIDSTLLAQAAQVIPVTGKDFFIPDFCSLILVSNMLATSICLFQLA